MAQRYTDPEARERLSQGRCPECGMLPDLHSSLPVPWERPDGCTLLPHGVRERIAQHDEDIRQAQITAVLTRLVQCTSPDGGQSLATCFATPAQFCVSHRTLSEQKLWLAETIEKETR